MDTSNRIFHIIPPDEDCCVWMTAGVLAYQLCDRKFSCEECAVDSAMRRRPRTVDVGAGDASLPMPGAAETALRENLRYSRNHCWARKVGADLFQIGIEPGLSSAIGIPKTIVLPSQGQRLQARQTCLWIVMTGGTYALECPMGGVVRRANSLLAEHPHLLFQSPFEQGWLYEMKADPAGRETGELVSAGQIAARYSSDESRFFKNLSAMIRRNQPDIGMTLADGGHRLQGIPDLVGPTRYFTAVRQAFS
jgi:glycine cleavage system H protein